MIPFQCHFFALHIHRHVTQSMWFFPYRFNIWYTGPDMNFDRIAHLAKLVFNTKGVMVSLIDSNEQ